MEGEVIKKIAVISDIHGNSWALKKVLQDIEDRGITEVINLGDCFYGPLDPAGTADLLFSRKIPTVRGNEDRIITDNITNSETISFVKNALKANEYKWLKSLTSTMIIGDIFFCHGTPLRDSEYFLWKVCEDNIVKPRSIREVEKILIYYNNSIVICGHSHMPNELKCSNGTWVIDPGSVGLQAFTHDQPFDHKIENGTPHARYSIIENNNTNLIISRVELEYDWDTASKTAIINDRPDWAEWLRTGIVK